MQYIVTAYNTRGGFDHSFLTDVATLLHSGYSSRKIVNAKLVEEQNKIESFTFSIYPDNPGYGLLKQFDTWVTIDEGQTTDTGEESFAVSGTTLYCPTDVVVSGEALDLSATATDVSLDGENLILGSGQTTETERLFDGRVLMVEDCLDSSGLVYRDVTCEGLAGYLNDSVQPYSPVQTYEDDPKNAWNTGLYKFVSLLIGNHNAHFRNIEADGSEYDTYKTVYLGDIDKSTHLTNTQVTKGLNWQTTWEAIHDKLIDSFGGECKVYRKTSDNTLCFTYRDALGETNTESTVRLAKNLKSMTVTPDYSAIITRLYPLGDYKTETVIDDDGNITEEQSDERIGIEDVNGGAAYIDDEDAIEKYGIIEGVQVWEDVTIPANLLEKSKEWLVENNKVQVSVTLDAYDLALATEGIASFKLLDSYLIDAPLLGFSDYLELVKKTTDLNNPLQSTYEFGKKAKTSTSNIVGSANDTLAAEKTQVEVSYQVSVANHTLQVTRKMKYV